MNLYRMWNVIVSTYDCNSSVHLFFLIFQHIRGKEIIKQKIPLLHQMSEICSMTW